MFADCFSFNQPVDISLSVTDCKLMFAWCNSFNQPLGSYDTPEYHDILFGNSKSVSKLNDCEETSHF